MPLLFEWEQLDINENIVFYVNFWCAAIVSQRVHMIRHGQIGRNFICIFFNQFICRSELIFVASIQQIKHKICIQLRE